VEPSADDVEDERATFIRTAAAAEQAHDEQSDDAAARAFYGIDEKKQCLQLGEPIPGYSGVNQRVEADNVFGMTYAEARRRAKESL
jgi:hypothetical protein